jgi:hypothetical protein
LKESDDSDGNQSDENSELETWADIHDMLVHELKSIQSKHYLSRGPYRSWKNSMSRYAEDLDDGMDETIIPWLKPEEFLEIQDVKRLFLGLG